VTGDFGLFGVVEDEVVTGYADKLHWTATVKTTEDNQTITFSHRLSAAEHPEAIVGLVDWGDGTLEDYPEAGTDLIHTYAVAGEYTIEFQNFLAMEQVVNFPYDPLIGLCIPGGYNSQALRAKAFYNRKALTTIELPHSINYVGSETFRGTGITTVVLPTGIREPGWSSFRDCKSLTTIELPKTLTSIANYAFAGCTAVTTVTIKAVTPPHMGTGSINGTSLTAIYVPAESVEAYKAADGWSTYANLIQAIE
jgi:hypothetical protein